MSKSLDLVVACWPCAHAAGWQAKGSAQELAQAVIRGNCHVCGKEVGVAGGAARQIGRADADALKEKRHAPR